MKMMTSKKTTAKVSKSKADNYEVEDNEEIGEDNT